MNNIILKTDFNFPGQTGIYHGKVRDVYTIDNDILIMIVTDRISAFDVILPRGIPFKGQVLNQIASSFLDATSDIVPNWKISSPDPIVTIGRLCKPFPVEMIVRGYLTGSSWRSYNSGIRNICGVDIPDGMREHERFQNPIITPTTKASEGHDEDITRDEIISSGLISKDDYTKMEKYALLLFERGTKIAKDRGLILVDTKYEFGKFNDEIYLIDEIHTPDSSRYFYFDEYESRFNRGEQQKQLSKEFVREWLMINGFQGLDNQNVPEMTDKIINSISDRYIELYEGIIGRKFIREDMGNVLKRVENNVLNFLKI